jgi:tRNA dimethylallyltransferase
LVLTGATGSGKSELGDSPWPNFIDGEIINADAFQVYQELTIATAAPNRRNEKEVPHHLYAFVPLTKATISPIIKRIAARRSPSDSRHGKTPILRRRQWSLYPLALYDYDLSLDTSKVDMSPYEGLNPMGICTGNWKNSTRRSEQKISPNNRRRVLRDIQICLASGESKTALLAKQTISRSIRTVSLSLTRNGRRFIAHAENGWSDVRGRAFGRNGAPHREIWPECDGLQSDRGQGTFPYLDKQASLEETKALIKKNTRHYIKNQYTWFRHQFPLDLGPR